MPTVRKKRQTPLKRVLLIWYAKNRRDLPWRHTKDPYAIWVSEIMLQQTQVHTVIPYYHKFLKKFKTLKELANAKESQLLNAWAGLGYYNRVRKFQQAARQVVDQYNGKIPQKQEELITLPGLGEYTSRALASIAFREPVAVVDGNVMRVLARLYQYGNEIHGASSKQFFQERADQLLDKRNPGDFNQAMMELGALICTPTKPHCRSCPLRKHCLAYKKGIPERFPVNSKKTKYVEENLLTVLLFHQGSMLLTKRDPSSSLKGMWEFPLIVSPTATALTNKQVLHRIRQHFKNVPSNLCALPAIRHSIMNRRMKVFPFLISLTNKEEANPMKGSDRWLSIKQLDRYPLTTVSQKILKSRQFLA